MKPAVDRLETELASVMPVLRLDIRSPLGAEYAAKFSVQAVPTLIILNQGGVEVARFHLDAPKAEQVARLAIAP